MSQERHLVNKVVIVTGGAQGIGFQITRFFLKGGVKSVIILDIDEEHGVKAIQELGTEFDYHKVEFINCDVAKDLEKVSKLVMDKYETVDILVNNAAIPESSMRKVIEVNLLAVMEWSKEFHDHMRVDKGGRGGTIINISSIYGFRTDNFAEAYVTSKHGVLGFTKTFGHKDNFKTNGVRVIAICPGFTETTLAGKSEHLEDIMKVQRATQLWQKPQDVGKAAAEIFEKADSGSVWIIEGAKPIEELRSSNQ